MKRTLLAWLLATTLGAVAFDADARLIAAPSPGPIAVSDVKMTVIDKRHNGSFTLRWAPAHDDSGHERHGYDILVTSCNVTTLNGASLPYATGGRMHAMAGPPYAVLLFNCTCTAAVSVYTATVTGEALRSSPVHMQRGIFGC